jgi:hypothetical protein
MDMRLKYCHRRASEGMHPCHRRASACTNRHQRCYYKSASASMPKQVQNVNLKLRSQQFIVSQIPYTMYMTG